MSLDLDVKIVKKMKVKDIINGCQEELQKLYSPMQTPEIFASLLENGVKIDKLDYEIKNGDVIIIGDENEQQICLVINDIDEVDKDIKTRWAGIVVQAGNKEKMLLAASLSLFLSKYNKTKILDERRIWSDKRENSYEEMYESICKKKEKNNYSCFEN